MSSEDFSAVYMTRSGSPLPLLVTVIPLKDARGELTGSVEILLRRQPDPGFFLAGSSPVAIELRQRLTDLARGGARMVIIGEAQSCIDVAQDDPPFCRASGGALRALVGELGRHPLLGHLAPSLSKPPMQMLHSARRRPTVGGFLSVRRTENSLDIGNLETVQLVELPALAELRQDLPMMIAARISQLEPGSAGDLDGAAASEPNGVGNRL